MTEVSDISVHEISKDCNEGQFAVIACSPRSVRRVHLATLNFFNKGHLEAISCKQESSMSTQRSLIV